MARLEFLQEAPEKVVHVAVRMKLKMQWRPHCIGEFRNVECLSRIVACNDHRGEGTWTAKSKIKGEDFSNLLELTSRYCVP